MNIKSFIGRGIGPDELSASEEERLKGLMTLSFPYYLAETNASGSIDLSLGLLPENEDGPGVFVVPSGNIEINIPIEDWILSFLASLQIDGFSISKNGFQIYKGAGNLTQFTVDLSLLKEGDGSSKALLIGSANATRFEIGKIEFGGGVSMNSTNQEFKIFVDLNECAIVIAASEGDAFLNSILGEDGINIGFNLKVCWSNLSGFHIEGSGGLEISLPAHISLGPIEIQNATIALKPNANNLPLELSSSFKGTLGPISMVVENIGLKLVTSFPSGGGNVGPLDFQAGFKPPNGLGLSINAGAVIGGGYLFFDFDREEYAGVMELTIAGFISAKAIGLITTKMPDGSKGFSMLIIITAEFNPPFQLGYGFTLIGVGGLLGLNRTVLLEPLRDGVRTGAVSNIMFPTNVVANAPRIISDLKTIFPVYLSRFLIGPMGKLGYGTPTLISLSLGLIIEIPGNIAILGVLKIVLPDEKAALIKLQVAFVGTIDFEKKLFTFDASLFESNILFMTLEGDMAVRLKWGDNPDFILSIGGFHPSYTPPPLSLPTLRRLAINILNNEYARIRIECYQAVTSNTVQFGAHADLYFGFSAISIEGQFGFDALFQFSPFYFIVAVSGSVALKVFGMGVFSIRLQLSLEGPTPWRAKGSGTLTLLFFEVSADFDKTWGDSVNTSLPEIEILPRFIEEFSKQEQWSAVLAASNSLLVTLRKFDEEEAPLVLHPVGKLIVLQKLLPLSVTIDKIGNQKTSDIRRINILSATSGGVSLTLESVNENFARAQYQNLSNAEKLSKPSFEKMPGGVSISMGSGTVKNGKMVRRKIEYEITIVDKEPRKPFKFGLFYTEIVVLFANFIKGGSVSKSVLSRGHKEKRQPFNEKLNTKEEGFAVAFTSNNKAYSTTAKFGSETQANDFMQDQILKNPSMKEDIHVVPTYELN